MSRPRPKHPRNGRAPSRKRGAPPPRRFPVVPASIALVVALAVIAVLVSGRGGDDTAVASGIEETRPVRVIGDPLLLHDDGPDAAVGTSAPELEGASFEGAPVRIGADGRPKVVVFLAHWCPHCQNEVPVLADWLAANGEPDGVDVYGVATGTTPEAPNYPPSSWLEREQFRVPVLADGADGAAADAFGVSGFPFFVAVDGDNNVIARASGELTVDQWTGLLDQAASAP